jgi:hypothetical protein
MNEELQAKIHSLFEKATPAVQQLILGDDVNQASAVLGKLYKLPISKYLPLKNAITLLLLGAVEPADAVSYLQTTLELDQDTAFKLAEDLDKTILQKARVALMGEGKEKIKVLTVGENVEEKKEELRKVILDTTKRESAIQKPPVAPGEKRPKKILVQGSRSQLVEQLNILGSIPDDDEIRSRLEHIRSQIQVPVEEEPPKPIPKELENKLSGGGQMLVTPKSHTATYSKAPTSYNIDPYREVAED